MPTPVLHAEDLRVRFYTKEGVVTAVNGVSFDLEQDSILCLVGESGAGKSTIGLTLLGLLPRAAREVSGAVEFGGRDIMSLDQASLRRIRGKDIAMIPQEPVAALNPILTIGAQLEEQILTHTDMSKRAAEDLSTDLLADMGLPDPKDTLKRYPFQLSGGMCQRVMISMAMALGPKVLIADEPTSNLDVTLQAEILDRLKRFCKDRHSSMILITHDMGVVARMADNVAVMYAGKIVEHAGVHELFRNHVHPYTWGLFRSVPRLDRPDVRFEPIHGTPPDLMTEEDTCPFMPRCHKATNQCRTNPAPALGSLTPAHSVACYNTMDIRWTAAYEE